ncbi:MAG: hypothetical protein AAGA50_10640 [Pseudomonadota bacterium]
MFFTYRSAIVATGLLAATFGTAMPAISADETKEAWRLFVTDQAEGLVTVIDPTQGNVLDRFSTTGYVTHLKPTESGKTLFAVQMDHDAVHVIETGITLSRHGDHQDITIKDAALLSTAIEGPRPVHAVMHDDKIFQFFDRDGQARVYDEADLLKGGTKHKVVETAAPHHGVVVPLGKYFVVSEPNLDVKTPADKLPPRLGAKVIDSEGRQVGEVATCTGLHGEATSAGLVAFGCAEGVLLARLDGSGSPQLELIKYAEEMPEGRVGTLAGGKALQFFLGDFGDDKLVLIDPSSDTPFRVVDLNIRDVHFVLDPVRVKVAYVFTEDGKLHALDVLSGELVRSVQVTEPYSKDGHWRDPRPRLAVMGNLIAVTDPREGLVRLLDVETFEEERTIAVEGLPFNIVAVGGSGLQH